MSLIGWTTSLQLVVHSFEAIFRRLPGSGSGTFPQSGLEYPRLGDGSCPGDDITDVTHLLNAINRGDPHAAADLLPLVYDELRRLAAARLADEPSGQTLQPTALVYEAYLS